MEEEKRISEEELKKDVAAAEAARRTILQVRRNYTGN